MLATLTDTILLTTPLRASLEITATVVRETMVTGETEITAQGAAGFPEKGIYYLAYRCSELQITSSLLIQNFNISGFCVLVLDNRVNRKFCRQQILIN